ncbi:hypothetical protein [Sulfuricystis multivorans]|uniref:hypothetical protein n=1 Tax=Sulfuricystis multivorans TaxID=2211108 RepID=UPI000F820828|nr:hypothetical protein [Sulfuricystis multivorans]
MAFSSAASRLPLLLLGMIALVTGVLAGLARLAVDVPSFAAAQAGNHGALMIGGFLGTVIALERAVALAGESRLWPFAGPLFAGVGGLAHLIGAPVVLTQFLFIAASAIVTTGSALLYLRQPAMYLATLTLGALSWFAGNLVWLVTHTLLPAVPWWLAFLVLTIAGERLELTRFLPTPQTVRHGFAAIIFGLLGAAMLSLWLESTGLSLFALMLVALAAWLLRHDIARQTIRQRGLTRYIAVCLLTGYFWLVIGGLLGGIGGLAPGSPWRDAALHAILLGFVFAMIFGHAPIIFPAVAKVKIPYHPVFYLPLTLLHLTVFARIAGDLASLPTLTQRAAIGNALTLLAFVLTILVRVFFAKAR